MYKATAVIGLVGLAAAGSPAGYSDAAPVTSSIAVYPSSSAVVDPSSAPAVYGSSSSVVYESSSEYVFSSSAFPVSSSAFPVSSSAPVFVSSSYVASSTSSAPVPIPTYDCWSDCFEASGVTSESDLCGNTAVSQCIHDTCSSDEDQKYWSWYNGFCAVSTTDPVASSTAYYPSTVSTITTSASATPTPDCWNTCFEEADITSEAELCGNCQVNECIYNECSQEDDMAYWSWYKGYCPAVSSSSSSPVTYPITYSASTTTSSVPVATPTGNCWSECFEENDVESEAELCGNDAVSQCIYDTCSSELDQAYWEWYGSFCAPATGTTTVVTVTTPTTPATWTEPTEPATYNTEPATWTETTEPATWNTEPYTTTYEQTNYPTTPIESSPVTTGWPSPPAAPPAYPTGPAAPPAGPWTSPYSYPPSASGTAWAPGSSPSGYVPVPATGAGVANKPAGVVAVLLAVAAFL